MSIDGSIKPSMWKPHIEEILHNVIRNHPPMDNQTMLIAIDKILSIFLSTSCNPRNIDLTNCRMAGLEFNAEPTIEWLNAIKKFYNK